MMPELQNPILYWYTTDGYSHHSVLNVWDYMVANKIIGKPVAMCRKEYLKLQAKIPPQARVKIKDLLNSL